MVFGCRKAVRHPSMQPNMQLIGSADLSSRPQLFPCSRTADHTYSANWISSDLPTTREVSHRGSNLVLGAFYGIMRTNCPDLPGQLQSRGGLPPENTWKSVARGSTLSCRIKAGNVYLRSLLVECANHVLGPRGKDSTLRQWGLHLASRGGKQSRNRAIVAVARKLAVLLHRIWVTQEPYTPFYAVAA
jgi:hypothetical protein